MFSSIIIPINLGSSEEITINRLSKIICEISGSSHSVLNLPLPVDDPLQRCPDLSRASELLGWKPTTDIKTGISKTYE